MSSLFWCFVIIGLAIYIFTVLFMSATAEYFQEVGPPAEGNQTSQVLSERYGGIYEGMLTLFMVITGGIDWGDAMWPLVEIHMMYAPIFLFYVFFMNFGVLNVVIGAFVAAAAEVASKDRDALVKYEIRRKDSYLRRIKTFFREADLDKNGTLSWEEFHAHLQSENVKGYFNAMDLDVSQAHVLFDLLDVDGNDSVTIEEFVDGVMRLKGHARSIDLNMLMLMNRKLYTLLCAHFEKINPSPRDSSS